MRSTFINVFLIVLLCYSVLGCSTRRVYRSSASNSIPPPNAININTATVDELENLPHIGRKIAESIVQFRTENGPFRRVEHLLQIRGVSEKRFMVIRQFLTTE